MFVGDYVKLIMEYSTKTAGQVSVFAKYMHVLPMFVSTSAKISVALFLLHLIRTAVKKCKN